jgi:cytochrome P450
MMGYLASGLQFESLMLKWRREYGPFFEFKMPGSPAVVIVADPEAIKEVYEVKEYPKSPRYADLLPIVGSQSMLLTEGHVWKSQREAFNPGEHFQAATLSL